MSNSRQLCTFYLDGHFFGVDVQSVQEVIRYQEMTRVPLAPRAVTGLINLRGQVVTAIDLRRSLGFEDRPNDRLPMNIVVRDDGGALSLLVDQIGDVIEVDQNQFETPPDTLQGPARALVEGAYKLDQKLLLVLNTAAAVRQSAA